MDTRFSRKLYLKICKYSPRWMKLAKNLLRKYCTKGVLWWNLIFKIDTYTAECPFFPSVTGSGGSIFGQGHLINCTFVGKCLLKILRVQEKPWDFSNVSIFQWLEFQESCSVRSKPNMHLVRIIFSVIARNTC